MRPMTCHRPAGAHACGFTLIEAMVVLAIIAIMAAVAIPSMSNWLLNKKAMSAAVFYQDGFAQARNTAIAHNAHTRLVLTQNAANGKMDWQIDLCFTTPCDDSNGSWSTATASAAGDPNPSPQTLTIKRIADGMPDNATLPMTVGPTGTSTVYFTPLGWVDTSVTPAVSSIDFKPPTTRPNAFKEIMVKLPLGGIAAICDPHAASHATNGCPP
jgi:type IV fimbrial biogenesis protein FimT